MVYCINWRYVNFDASRPGKNMDEAFSRQNGRHDRHRGGGTKRLLRVCDSGSELTTTDRAKILKWEGKINRKTKNVLLAAVSCPAVKFLGSRARYVRHVFCCCWVFVLLLVQTLFVCILLIQEIHQSYTRWPLVSQEEFPANLGRGGLTICTAVCCSSY